MQLSQVLKHVYCVSSVFNWVEISQIVALLFILMVFLPNSPALEWRQWLYHGIIVLQRSMCFVSAGAAAGRFQVWQEVPYGDIAIRIIGWTSTFFILSSTLGAVFWSSSICFCFMFCVLNFIRNGVFCHQFFTVYYLQWFSHFWENILDFWTQFVKNAMTNSYAKFHFLPWQLEVKTLRRAITTCCVPSHKPKMATVLCYVFVYIFY